MAEELKNPERTNAIWHKVVKPIADSFIMKTSCFYDIQMHFNEDVQMAGERYGIGVLIHAYETRSCRKVAEGISPFSCRMLPGNQPEVAVWIDHLDAAFSCILAEAKGDYSRAIPMARVCVIEGIMHEFDHFALGTAFPDATPSEILEAEALTWARTCKNVLVPLREVHHHEFASSEWEAYNAWIENPDANSPGFRAFIAKRYVHVK